jgi:hypothetical protein
MVTLPDFSRAHYVVSPENPYKLTPPNASTLFMLSEKHCASSKGSAAYGQHGFKGNDTFEDPSYDEVFNALKNAYKQKQAQYFAFADVLDGELQLIKKSIVVSAFSALAVFALAIVCWLLVNALLAGVLFQFGAGFLTICTLLLIGNIGLTVVFVNLAKSAYQYVGITRIMKFIKRCSG